MFRAVSIALVIVVAASLWHPATRPDLRKLREALGRIAEGAAPLVAAAGSVGIILGMVTLTGLGTRFPAAILSVAGEGLLPALLLIMVGSVVLGMGLPSAVCYLLMAILIGPVIGQLGVPALAVHFFIFYFGMMSMVTPPVALAAYTTAGIAGTPILPAALTAFRFALAGFALPYFFVFRPELLLILDGGRGVPGAVVAFGLGTLSVVALAAGIAGWLRGPLGAAKRAGALGAAALLLWPPQPEILVSLPEHRGAPGPRRPVRPFPPAGTGKGMKRPRRLWTIGDSSAGRRGGVSPTGAGGTAPRSDRPARGTARTSTSGVRP